MKKHELYELQKLTRDVTMQTALKRIVEMTGNKAYSILDILDVAADALDAVDNPEGAEQ